MKKSLFTLILLASLTLSGCIKEALLMDDLRGEWVHYGSYYSFTALKDFKYPDFNSNSWQGTVTINGEPLTNCTPGYSPTPSSKFYINPEISLYSKSVYYKSKRYDYVDISFENIETGRFITDFTIVHEGAPINIKIDLTAPQIEAKKGERCTIVDRNCTGNYLFISQLNFISSTKISGTATSLDMRNRFNGTWSVSNGKMHLKYKTTDLWIETKDTILKYKIEDGKLLFLNTLEYSKNHIYGLIPKENIKDIVYYNRFTRSYDSPV